MLLTFDYNDTMLSFFGFFWHKMIMIWNWQEGCGKYALLQGILDLFIFLPKNINTLFSCSCKHLWQMARCKVSHKITKDYLLMLHLMLNLMFNSIFYWDLYLLSFYIGLNFVKLPKRFPICRRWSSCDWNGSRSTSSFVRLGLATELLQAELGRPVLTGRKATWRMRAATHFTRLVRTEAAAEGDGPPTASTLDMVRRMELNHHFCQKTSSDCLHWSFFNIWILTLLVAGTNSELSNASESEDIAERDQRPSGIGSDERGSRRGGRGRGANTGRGRGGPGSKPSNSISSGTSCSVTLCVDRF